MKSLLSFLMCMLSLLTSVVAQNSTYTMKGNSDEIDANFLSSYYQQDGNNGAVTGGIGTEKLEDIAAMLIVNIPIDSINSINVMGGIDSYSSASTDNIDNVVSSASRKDSRTYGTLAYSRKNLLRGTTYGIRVGGSSEYDYTSFSAGLSFAKEFNEGNSEVSVNGQAFFDNWSVIFPGELRGVVSVPTSARQSYNAQATFSQVINKRMQFSISAEGIYMRGLLSTPFHRVYFSDQTRPDIERLPDTRLKIPVGIRLNIFPIDKVILRTYYRFYWDNWGIQAHTLEIETPIKLSKWLTVAPFYRYYTQTSADYFAPYAIHTSTETLYTSDYDLSALSSHKAGLGIKIAPTYGIAHAKVPFTQRLFSVKSVTMRGAYYQRSTGLNAYIGSINLSFGILKIKK